MVGGGITSAVTSSILQERLSQSAHILAWDKAKGPGGRMSTSRSPTTDQCIADLGAQYISAKPEYVEVHSKIYSDLKSENLIQESNDQIENIDFHLNGETHYVASEGTSSIVKHFFKKSGVQVEFNSHVKDMKITGDKKILVETTVCS